MTPRRVRAVALISISLVAIAIVSAVYLAPLLRNKNVGFQAAVPSPPARTTVAGESITFAFVSPNAGWAAAAVTTDRLWIYSTTDGARSWHVTGTIEALPETRVTGLRFFDRSHGLVVLGTDAYFAYRTSDGGKHWTSIQMPDPTILSMSFSDPDHGWAATGFSPGGVSRLFATADGGAKWTELPAPPVYFGEPVFRSPAEGWLGGSYGNGVVYGTDDGGLTWQPHQLPQPPCTASKFGCAATGGASTGGTRTAGPPPGGYPGSTLPVLIPGGGVAVDFYPACPESGPCPPYGEVEFVSFDVGRTWRFIPFPPGGGGYHDICFQDSNHWWVIRGNTLYKTSDAGLTWTPVTTSIMYDALQPTITDAQHAWVMLQTQDDAHLGTRPNTVWELDMTSDGGLHWTQETVPVPV